jgi:hypothetical protein
MGLQSTDTKMPLDPEPAEPPTELGELSHEPVKDDLAGAGQDAFTVKWDGEDDPGDPLNTPVWRKWYVLCDASSAH